MAGMLPPALGQVQPTAVPGGGTAFAAPDAGLPSTSGGLGAGQLGVIRPPQTPAQQARAQAAAAQKRYEELMAETVEQRLLSTPDPFGLGNARYQQVEAQLKNDRAQARAAATEMAARAKEAEQAEAAQTKAQGMHDYPVTDPRTGQTTTVRLNDEQYAARIAADARAANAPGAQTVTLPDGSTVTQAQAQQLKRDADIAHQQRLEQIMKDARDMQAAGKAADEVAKYAGAQIAAAYRTYDADADRVKALYLQPFQQMKAQENARLGKAVDFASSLNTNRLGYYKADATSATSQRNKDMDLYVDLLKTLLNVHENRIKNLMTPEQVQKEMSTLHRYAGAKLGKIRTAGGGIQAAGTQDRNDFNFTGSGQGPDTESQWRDPTQQEQDAAYRRAGYQAVPMPNDPVAWAGANARQQVLDVGKQYREGPGYPNRPYTYGPNEVPGFVDQMTAGSPWLYQYPDPQAYPAAPDFQGMATQYGIDPATVGAMQAYAYQGYAGRGPSPDQPIDSGMNGGPNGLSAMPQQLINPYEYDPTQDEEPY